MALASSRNHSQVVKAIPQTLWSYVLLNHLSHVIGLLACVLQHRWNLHCPRPVVVVETLLIYKLGQLLLRNFLVTIRDNKVDWHTRTSCYSLGSQIEVICVLSTQVWEDYSSGGGVYEFVSESFLEDSRICSGIDHYVVDVGYPIYFLCFSSYLLNSSLKSLNFISDLLLYLSYV